MSHKKEDLEVNKGGRPRKEIDKDVLSAIAFFQPTYEEIAAALKISVNTFKARMSEDKELADIVENSRNLGKMSLRRVMWKSAQNGNCTMQIWLSKQWLGMNDKIITIDEKEPLDLSTLTKEQLSEQIERHTNHGN